MKNLKIFTSNVEEKALEEINALLEQEAFKDCKVRIMPDVNADTLDEAPFVYKPIQEIIDNIKDTVDIIKIIKPIYNFKSK